MHRVRLGFSDAAAYQQVSVLWQELPWGRVQPGGEVERYYSTLLDLRQRYSTLEIVGNLARQTKPLEFAEARAFVAVLAEIDQPHRVWQGVRTGRGDAAAVRSLFGAGAPAVLTPPQRADCLSCLLADFHAEDAEVLRRCWQPELLPALLQASNSALAGGQVGELWALADLATGQDLQAELRLSLLRYVAGDSLVGEERAAARVTVAAVTRDWLVVLLRREERLRALLVDGNRPVLYDVIVALAQADRLSDLKLVFEAMGREERDLLAFQIACGLLGREAAEDTVEAVAAAGPRYVRALVDLAYRRAESGAPARLLPATAAWLVQVLDSLPAEEKQEWGVLLADVSLAAYPLPAAPGPARRALPRPAARLAPALLPRTAGRTGGGLPRVRGGSAAPQRPLACGGPGVRQ